MIQEKDFSNNQEEKNMTLISIQDMIKPKLMNKFNAQYKCLYDKLNPHIFQLVNIHFLISPS